MVAHSRFLIMQPPFVRGGEYLHYSLCVREGRLVLRSVLVASVERRNA